MTTTTKNEALNEDMQREAEAFKAPYPPASPQPAMRPMPAQTIKAVVLPVDQYNEIITGLQHAPKNVVDPILRGLSGVQVQDVNIGPRSP